MTYLVTGGTGLVGRHVTRLLIQDGERVVIHDIVPMRESLEHTLGKEISSEVEILRGDVRDLASLIRTAQKYKVERIIHLAAYMSRPYEEENPLEAVHVDCIGTINVLETARILKLKKVVWSIRTAREVRTGVY
jgi:nucleoside-diphosphate-sugar epimerase